MAAYALVSGTLYHAPDQRTSKSGRAFVTATLKVKDGNDTQWWKLVAFSESVQAELLRLQDGDAISVQGVLTAGLYDKDGEKRISLSIIADNVLALRQSSRKTGEKRHPAALAQCLRRCSSQDFWQLPPKLEGPILALIVISRPAIARVRIAFRATQEEPIAFLITMAIVAIGEN